MTAHIPFTEVLKSIPGFFGIRLEEHPKYEVVDRIGDVEVRRYAPAVLAEITLKGTHGKALDHAFDRLADYVFGGNQAHQTMAMTSPVLQRPEGTPWPASSRVGSDAEQWTIAFFLGNDLTAQEMPAPNDPAIHVVRVDTHLVAALTYHGNNTDDRRRRARDQLVHALNGQSVYRIDDRVMWAQFDGPVVLPFAKKNEAQVAVKRA
jgi:hypothetical protein